MSARLTAAAHADLRDALSWYRSRRKGLDSDLLDAVDSALNRITMHPELGQVVHGEIRRVLLRGFPYGLFYVQRAGEIVVVACMHGAREPRQWKSRGAG